MPVDAALIETLRSAGDFNALIATLGHGDRRIREAAAEALGELGHPSAVDPLILVLGDSHKSVRVAAAKAIRQLGSPRALEPLLAALHDPDWLVRKCSADALGSIGNSRAVDGLILAASDRDYSVRNAAITALGKIGDPRAVVYILSVLEHYGNDAVVEALARIGVPAIEPLLLMVQRSNFRVEAVSDILSRMGVSAIEALVSALGHEHRTVRKTAARALGRLVDTRAVRHLIFALGDGDCEVREAAARALGEIGDTHAIEPVLALLRDRNVGVRHTAARALAAIGGPALDRLLGALRDEDAGAREAAVRAVARIGAGAVAPLVIALEDRDPQVRAAAVESLGQIGDRRAVEPLIFALENLGEHDRRAAATVLGKIGDQRAVEPLIVALEDPVEDVRFAAVRSLGQIGDARAVEPLIRSLQSGVEGREVHVHDALLEALKQIGGDRAQHVLASQRLRRSYNIHYGDMESTERLTDATNVQLTAFYPQRIRPDFWYNLVAYVHLLGAEWAVRADSKRFLSVGGTPLGEIGRLSKVKIAPGAEIMVIPELTGCRFNPESVRLRWLEDWHRAEFRLQTGNSIEGFTVDRALNGRVAFYVEGLLVGETPIWSYVSADAPTEEDAALKDSSTSLFQAIFASYSHEDFEVVESLAKAYKALGNSFFYDAETLRSGEKWNERLLELIERVDIFQLYWSEAAKRSRNVENEWRCALALNRSAFIRPVYWHQPMAIPPHELADIHFAYCAMQARPLG